LNNNQSIVVFTLAVAAILYGTLGFVLLSILSRRYDRDLVALYEPFESEENF